MLLRARAWLYPQLVVAWRLKMATPMLGRRLACSAGALVLATASACTDHATLASLPSLRVAASATVGVEDAVNAPARVQIELQYDVDAFLEANGECALIREPHATLAGVPVELVDPGQTSEGEGDDGRPYTSCGIPRLEALVDLPRDAAADLVIEDASMSIRATYEPGTLVPRRARMVYPMEWSIRTGQIFTFEWSHPEDLETGLQVWIGSGYYDRFPATPISQDGARVSMRMPADAPLGDSTAIQIVAGSTETYDWGYVQTCSGPDSCIWSATNRFFHTLAVIAY